MMDITGRTWKLVELAEEVGTAPRTIRYYVQRGLLPAPAFRGKDTAYTEEHRLRLLAIRRLQDQQLPLEAIHFELSKRTPEQLRALAEGEEVLVPPEKPAPGEEPDLGRGARGSGRRGVYFPAPFGPFSPTATSHWERIELLPGLELHLSTGADATTRALAEELKAYVTGRIGIRGGRG